MNRDTNDGSDCPPRVKTYIIELAGADSMHENEEPTRDSERDDDNQDDSEGDGDFSDLAAETSSLTSSDSSGFVCNDQGAITAVRLRPMLASEKKSGYRAIVDMSVDNDFLVTKIVNPTALPPPSRSHASSRYPTLMKSTPDVINFPAQFTQEFKFDHSYWSFDRSPAHQVATQSMVYSGIGVLALETVLQGQNCSVFAHGQPGAGKTYTMMGSSGERTSFPASVSANNSSTDVRVPSALLTSERRGLIPRICQGLLTEIDERKTSGNSLTLIMSYVEIYDERVYDLLSQASTKKSLKVREHPEEGAFVERAQRVHITSYSQAVEMIEEGTRTRSVTSSQSSCRPSRSHTVLVFSLTQTTLADSASMSSEARSPEKSLKSRLCLVDLASSERMDRSGTNGLGLREAASINRSLATLADVVSALAKRRSNRYVDGSKHQKTFVPYRNSVLTRLLKESLGGRSKTIMLGVISPCCAHYEESIATLRYIERAKSVYGTTRAHVDTNGDTTQRFLNEASELKSNLCDSNLSEVTMANACGIPEYHEDRVDCESCDQISSDDSTVNLKSPATCKQELTKDAKTKNGSSTSENKLEVETWAGDAQHEEMRVQVLRKSVFLLKIVDIRRRCQMLRKYRALDRWRKLHAKTIVNVQPCQDKMEQVSSERSGSAALSPLCGRKAGCPPLHTRTPTAEKQTGGRVQDVVAAVVATDAICCSVVQEFLFPHTAKLSMNTSSTSLLELLASSSEFDRSDFRLRRSENEQRLDELAAAAENWCPLEDGHFKEELTTLKSYDSNSCVLSPGIQYKDNSVYSSLSLCVDSIDMARRALGPGERNLQRRTKDDKRTSSGSTGAECELLRYLDKRFVLMARRLEDLISALQSHPETRTPSQSCCESLETMIGEFCLQIITRLCNQLPSASSACVAGRLQLDTQLKDYSQRLRQLLPDIARGSGDIETNSGENAADAVFSVATDLLVMTERIKLVWSFAEHKKRGRLLQAQVLEAATIKDRTNAADIAALEEQNAELSARCDVLAATSRQFEEQTTNGLSALEALQDRVVLLRKELESANSHSNDLEGQLKRLKSTDLELCSELQSVKALLACEKEARTSVEADLLKMQANVKMEKGLQQQRDDAETRVRKLEEIEAKGHEINETLVITETRNAELSASLMQAKAELLITSEKVCQVESESVRHVSAIEGLKVSLYQSQAQRELAEMAAEELLSKLETVRIQISGQVNQICELETRIRHEEQNMQELWSKVTATVHDRDEQVLLLSETEEALAIAREREIFLTSQLDMSSSHDLDEINRVRGDLHEATLEIGSLREELTQLLDHSTLQSTTIETLKLKQTEIMTRADELEFERDELVLLNQRELRLLELKERARQMADLHAQLCVESLSRQLETERQGSMAMHETLQQQVSAFLKLQAQQHSFDVSHSRIVRELETQVETLSTEVQILETKLTTKANELESSHGAVKAQIQMLVKQTQSSEALVLQHHQASCSLTKQLDECQMDLHASTRRWVRAETQNGLLRICIARLNSHLVQMKEASLKLVADIESARLRDDSCPMFTEVSYGTEQTVSHHLSSVDAWFEEVISGNHVSATDPTSATVSVEKRSNIMDEDYAGRSPLLKSLTNLSSLSSGLLTVCEASPQIDDQTAEGLIKGNDHHDTRGLVEDLHEATFEGKEVVTIQITKTSSEVVQLRKVVVKLKEALDAKDDMLQFLDGKVTSLELLASK